VPAVVAQVNPIYAPAAESATVLIAASIVVTAILCPIVTVMWARLVLKQPAGGSREIEAAQADLHVHLDHIPADTGESALQAAHLRVIDDTAADLRSPGTEHTRNGDRSNGDSSTDRGSVSEPSGDLKSRRPDTNDRRDQGKGNADA
jgi:2-keto-3-deoxygluconate permease